jgi:negative regulator of sigma E activity
MSSTSATLEPFTFTQEFLEKYTFVMGNISGGWDQIETTLGKDTLTKAIRNGDAPNNTEMTWSPLTFTTGNCKINTIKTFDRDASGLSGMMVWANTNIDVYVTQGTDNFIFPKGTPISLKLSHYDGESVVGTVIFWIDYIRYVKKFFPITSKQMKTHNFTLGNIRGNMSNIRKILGDETLSKATKNDAQPNSVGMTWTPATFTVSNLEVDNYYQEFHGETGLNCAGDTNIDINVSSSDGKTHFVFPKGTRVCLSLSKEKYELPENAVGTVTFDIDDIQLLGES